MISMPTSYAAIEALVVHANGLTKENAALRRKLEQMSVPEAGKRALIDSLLSGVAAKPQIAKAAADPLYGVFDDEGEEGQQAAKAAKEQVHLALPLQPVSAIRKGKGKGKGTVNGYNLYCKKHYPMISKEMKEQGKDINNKEVKTEIFKQVGVGWKGISATRKDQYTAKAAKQNLESLEKAQGVLVVD